jgi:hypothetical protein
VKICWVGQRIVGILIAATARIALILPRRTPSLVLFLTFLLDG